MNDTNSPGCELDIQKKIGLCQEKEPKGLARLSTCQGIRQRLIVLLPAIQSGIIERLHWHLILAFNGVISRIAVGRDIEGLSVNLTVAKKRSKKEMRVLGGTGSSSPKRVTDFPNLYTCLR